jgi:hypothetical protein
MKKPFLLILLLVSYCSLAQKLPIVSEPPVLVLYRFYPNLVQLSLAKEDYNDYILVNDSCEVLLYDKAENRLAPNNFIIKIPWTLRTDSIHFQLFNRSNMGEELGVISFDIVNPPDEVIFLDGIKEGGKCSKRPVKFEARNHTEAPINLFFEVEFWMMEIGGKEVFGKDGKFDDYAYSVIDEFPSGTEVKFKCRIVDELEYSSYHEAKFYLE